MNLSKSDYKQLLNYYAIQTKSNSSLSSLKKAAEKIIAQKLCSCVKKVPNKNQPESRAIGICNYSIIQQKNLKINGFTCKKKMTLKTSSTNKQKLMKNGSQLTLKTKTKKQKKQIKQIKQIKN
jgi:hypothetical protein